MLELTYCRRRQQRLVKHLQDEGITCAILSNPKTIYYLSGVLVDPMQPHAFGIDDGGRTLLVTNQEPAQAAADTVRRYTGYTIERIFNRTTMQAEIDAAAGEWAREPVALETDWAPQSLAAKVGAPARDISGYLNTARQIKDPDEIACMRAAVHLVETAYSAIKPRLEPGMTEYQAYNIIHEAMVNEAETSVLLNGDFACGVRAIGGGGPPTDRRLQSGDLCVYDLFPIYNGYMCDLCRTFVVGRASALQQETWACIMEGHNIAALAIRPGVRGREVYAAIRDHLERYPKFRGSFTHHAGHAVGMDGWEFPWLTPGSDQLIQAGNVLACEPGLYGEEIQGGIRLEHNYLVRDDGIEPLDSFPMELYS